MNKKIFFILLLHLFILGLFGNWQEEIKKYFKKAHEYDKLAKYLETNMQSIPDAEKPLAVIILGYTYKELGDRVNEKKWISRFFENYKIEDADIKFLNPKENVKIFEYQTRWLRKYPKLKAITVNHKSGRIQYFNSPAEFFIDIDMQAAAEIVVRDNKMAVISSQYLRKGINTIALPFSDNFKKIKENRLFLLLKTDVIEINKTITLSAGYEYPGNVEFDSAQGSIAIKGKAFKKEKSESVAYETRKYFDKKFFYKKSLLHMGLGGALMVVNGLFIRPMAERENQTARQRALWDGTNKITTVLTIGISLKGILNVFKSFKKEKKRTVQTNIIPGAAAFNRELRRQIETAKTGVFITYQLFLRD